MTERSVTATWFSDGSGAWVAEADGAPVVRLGLEQWR